MINLDKIAEELFNKIRGRYPSVTLGDTESLITNVPGKARFFDFDFKEGVKVNVTLDEKSLTILYNNDLIENSPDTVKSMWFDFMKEMRTFAKKRMLNFDTRNITKTNLDKRDYQYLSQNRPGDETMSESKMYGTSKTSFQDIGNAKMIVKHRGPVDFENPAGRTQQIDSIYIESADGERFKYPFRHLNGARAMATHVSEGGNQYDTFGKHIVSLSEELSKLRTFKTYMNRSAVMAEGLAGYMDVVNERIETIKETVFKLQRPTHYKEAFESFEETVMEEVPEDVSSNWIDELTIRQFNEDLKSVFPYIYNLVKENTKAKQIGPDDLLGEFDGPDETQDGGKKEQLKAWYDKYSKYEGTNGDPLPKGMFLGYIDTGILSDGVEGDELMKAVDEMGGDRDEAEQELFSNPEKFAKMLPITNAMQEEYKKIMGVSEIDEDDCREAVKILGDDTVGFGVESMDMNDNYASHLDNIVATSKHEQGPVQEEGAEDIDKVFNDIMKQDPGDEGIGYLFDKVTTNMTDQDADELAKKLAEFYPEWYEQHYQNEGNEFAQKVQALKAKGAKPGTKFKTSDGEEHTLEDAIKLAGLQVEDFWTAEDIKKDFANMKDLVKGIAKNPFGGDKEAKKANKKHGRDLTGRDLKDDDDTMDVKIDKDGAISKADAPDKLHDKEEELPLDEFIKGHFDYTTNQFPKGETAVLTAVEKKYGDDAISSAAEIMKELVTNQDEEMSRIKTLAGLAH